jgi:hypothetical protein
VGMLPEDEMLVLGVERVNAPIWATRKVYWKVSKYRGFRKNPYLQRHSGGLLRRLLG